MQETAEHATMTEIVRIPAEEVREKVLSGEALLVCAYEDEEKFRRLHLEGAISLAAFRRQAEALSREREIIFY